MSWVTLLFLVGGIVLVASEALHLSLWGAFLGTAALAVAGLRGLGLIEDTAASFLAWSIISVALALPLRPLARKYLKTGERRFDHGDEDTNAMGQIVEVVEDVDEVTRNGRVRFQGTTWAAQTTSGRIAKGAKVKLVVKDKTTWIVEPLTALDDVNAIPAYEVEAATVGDKKEKL